MKLYKAFINISIAILSLFLSLTMAAQEQKKAAEAAAAIEALKKQKREKQLRLIRKKQREAYYNSLNWVKAWPKPEATKSNGTGGNE